MEYVTHTVSRWVDHPIHILTASAGNRSAARVRGRVRAGDHRPLLPHPFEAPPPSQLDRFESGRDA